jgi:hypothetical protein
MRWDTASDKPCRRGLDQTGPYADATRFADHDDVMDEARNVAKLLPRPRLHAGIYIADDAPGALGDKDRDVLLRQLCAKELGIALFQPWPRGKEPA